MWRNYYFFTYDCYRGQIKDKDIKAAVLLRKSSELFEFDKHVCIVNIGSGSHSIVSLL